MSLVDATLNFDFIRPGGDSNDDSDLDPDDGYESIQKVLRGLLESLVHVKNITLGTWAIQVLSIMEAKGLRSPLLKCECLRLDTHIFKSVLPGIANLLESSPNLETFRVTAMSSSCYCKVQSSMEAKGLSLPLVNCTSLTLEACLCDEAFPWIATMFGLSPNLETLVMTKSSSGSFWGCWKNELDSYNAEHYWIIPRGFSSVCRCIAKKFLLI